MPSLRRNSIKSDSGGDLSPRLRLLWALLVLCAWCACRTAMGDEYRLRGSPPSERAARRISPRSDAYVRLDEMIDEIRRAKLVSRSLATAKVSAEAIRPSTTDMDRRPPSEVRAHYHRDRLTSCRYGVFVSTQGVVGHHGRGTPAGIGAGGTRDQRHVGHSRRKVASCIGFDGMGGRCLRDLHGTVRRKRSRLILEETEVQA